MNCRPYSTSPRRQRWWQRGALALGTAALLGLPAVQAQFVIIGTDAVSTAGTGSDPVDDYFNFMRYQTVYTAAELSGAGMPAGAQISALGFSVIEDNGPAFPTYTIRMAHTTATNSAAHDAAALTTVFGPASYDAVTTLAGSHDMISFSSNFTWNGVDNILVDICTGTSSMPYASPYGGVRGATVTNGSRRVRCDGCGTQCSINTNTTNTVRPQIRFNYLALSCTQPAATGTVSAFSCASPNYTVDVNLTSLGDAPTVDIVSSVHGIIADDVSALTVYTTPSTPWGTPQTITVLHNGDNTCDIVVGTFNQTDNDDVCHAASTFPIPDNGCATLNYRDVAFCVSDPGTVLGTDVYVSSVDLIIAHTWNDDMDIQLINPNGTAVNLVLDRFGSGDNLGNPALCPAGLFTLQDGGAALTVTATSNVVGTYNPEQPLTTLHDGSNPNGVWTLRVCDDAIGDLGDVRFVKVNLIPCLAPTATSSSTNDCGTGTYTASVNVTALGTSASVDITSSVHGTLFSGVGTGVYASNPTALGTPETITVVASNPACNLTYNFTNADNDEVCHPITSFPVSATFPITNVPFCVSDPGTALGTDAFVQSVDLIISHTWNEDMDVQLINANGTIVNLVFDRFGSGDNLGDPSLCPGGLFTLQAGGTALNNTITSNVVGTYAPEQPLSTLHDGSDPNGTWILRVTDDTGGDDGGVRYVGVNIVPCEAPVAGGQTIVPACGTNEYFIDVNLSSLGSSASVDLSNDFNANVVTANAPGVWQVGPFPTGTTVTVTLEASNALCDVSLAPQTYNCPPPNDDCSGAIAVNCNSITNGNTQFATLDAVGTCTTALNTAPGVWYTVTGTGGEIKIALCGSAYDTKLGVFTGSCGTLTCLEGNDDDNGTNGLDVCANNLHSSLSFPSTFGTTYYVLVTGYLTNAGAFSMEVTCAGNNLPPCQDNEVTLNLRTDDFGSETSWNIVPFGNTLPVCSGSGYPNNADVTVSCCLIDGCYDLNVFDSFGDGLSLSTPAGLGGYSLVDANGNRIIDNTADGDDFTFTSSAASPFCLPLGTDKLLFSSCDREDWTPNEFVVAAENAAVSAQWLVGDQTDDGYQFWFFNPDGVYNRRIFRNHATSGGFGPPSATRACHVKISSMVTAPVPYDVLLNVRVRSRVNGVYSEFGPACRFLMPTTPPACPPTSLVNNPNNPNFSCGVIKTFGGSDKVYANPVTGANKYRWRFERDGGGFTRVISSNTATLVLNWLTQPLVDGDTYNVTVAASFDNGANYCPYGLSCQVTIDNSPAAQARAMETASGFSLYPNPNRGDQVVLNITDLPESEVLVTVDIVDVFGKRVMSMTEGAQNGSLNLVLALDNSLVSGMYTVQVTAGEQTFTERLVINK
ncbi:MAG TPA: T9SS type A sorting domain-containing protein [Flavobacteriales bacterium]|nr:T9SS type A sorting domain-containing protein [Flavobacteriales bacterium]HMR29098.1 T9SS type A sorting domain-containing protein [Flavobacteriales bacterium]